ncbi:3,4-dihydroxy 2-butanone 4-phosphate synthase/GTP cyclohydrolase II [Thermosporothrix hazakensis]|jgi:3,4-dihydroxy 2-butanone 4-phosphate synthase/GTP cyclohydrolase II|uniref:Multifunctional fusion protein n=1 Tax=Thermosporothrix hazakensis TaxID=644383 RepID=A0A326U7L4_THEHA|nr:GTP cyclohydrolase II [Thermosporothrix hazakensis]PZW29448.1 3,4-dihydroxy 2-butanone 4-phosphate synthase/GTP cyclohydrolase II [Thermosporothrix hazakensis]GCE45836.1 riboflavin biosynthesis protein RibBA [Thermosporothrix hazakensis]
MNTPFISVRDAIDVVRQGNMILICDDESRENEADLCIAAQFVTPEVITFMMRNACGLICVALTGQRLDTLQLPVFDQSDQPLQGTAFTLSVDARHGTTTGISAHDRARTIRVLVDPATRPEDLARPGHIFPLRAATQGTLERRGHTEASVDLMSIAGLEAAAVICEVLNEHGEPARGEELHRLAQQWNIPVLTVEAIASYRRQQLVSPVASTRLPTPFATFQVTDYLEHRTGQHTLALVLGDLHAPDAEPPLVRLHSSCLTGDIFGSQRCDCQAQLHAAMQAIADEGRGVLLYLPQEGRGIGLMAKLQAYALQDQGHDTITANERLGYPADARDYTSALAILHTLGVKRVRLLTNNPQKLQALAQGGIEVERVALETTPTPHNITYLTTKQQRMGHALTMLHG